MQYTKKQLNVLKLIYRHQNETGVSPSYAELGKELSITAVSVYDHIRALEKKGAIRRRRHEARSVEIIDVDFLKTYAEECGKAHGHRMPVSGTIAAGIPIEAVETEEWIDTGELFSQSTDYFMLRVRGDSMIDDHICDGDLVVVRRTQNAENGDIIVALLEDGTATLKRLYRESNGLFRLQPANGYMKPIIVKTLEIQGIVDGVVRRS
jgi:repressor LexA